MGTATLLRWADGASLVRMYGPQVVWPATSLYNRIEIVLLVFKQVHACIKINGTKVV